VFEYAHEALAATPRILYYLNDYRARCEWFRLFVVRLINPPAGFDWCAWDIEAGETLLTHKEGI